MTECYGIRSELAKCITNGLTRFPRLASRGIQPHRGVLSVLQVSDQ